MRTYPSTALLAALAAGAVLTQAACGSLQETPADPVTFTPPSSSPAASGAAPDRSDASPGEGASAPKDPILAGKRQIVIKPNPSFEEIVAVGPEGRLGVTDGPAPKGLFVITPVGDKFQIKTATVEAGGESSCMGIKHNGSDPLTVEAAPCDASRAGQLFTITKQKKTDNGRPTYAISSQDAFLQIFPRGLIAEELGDAPLKTTYTFVDNGPSKLPALD